MNVFISFILDIDYQIFKWINQTSAGPFQDMFFPLITDLHLNPFVKWPFLIFMLVIFLRKFQRLGFTLFLILLVAVGFNDFMGSKVKNHFLRLRPFENTQIEAVQKSPAGSKSFYSNHTSNMFTFATYTTAFFPAAAIPAFAAATLVAYSRIYNGVHYPSDVAAGAMMGIIWGLMFRSIARRALKYLKKANPE